MMKPLLPKHPLRYALLILLVATAGQPLMAQEKDKPTHKEKIEKKAEARGKAVIYNAFGAGAYHFLDQKMIGGNHVAYRKSGFVFSWRVGLRNYEKSKSELSQILYENAKRENWLTGKYENYYSYSFNLGYVHKITKKIPFYVAAGVVRQRQFAELVPFSNPAFPNEWAINPSEVKFLPNFTAGVFIPLFSYLVLNVGYDHMPQTVFIGLAIQGPYNYEDIDMW